MTVTLAKHYNEMTGKKEKNNSGYLQSKKMGTGFDRKDNAAVGQKSFVCLFFLVTADEKWCLPILNREIWNFFFNTPDSQSLVIRGSMFTAKLKTINFIQWV